MADTTAETTTTTTTVTSSRVTTVSCNVGYITSLPGILKLAELIFGLLCWASVASWYLSPYIPAFQFVMFVSVTAWVLTLISFFIYLTALHATTCSGAPWLIMEFAFNLFWGVFYFIAACVDASWAYYHSSLAASTAFAFFATITYLIHTVVAYKEWRGAWPWKSTNASAEYNQTNPS